MAETNDDETIVTLDNIPSRLGVSERSVRDRRWRQSVGLRVVRVGRKILGAREADLEAVQKRGF